jgi:hypothetical protein
MPEQHREFFPLLPFLIVGPVDDAGQPWASAVTGPSGFITSPDAHHLYVSAQPLPGDPLAATLHEGAAIGLLGIQPHTRRRNRMNGIVESLGADGFSVRVVRSFGNCPKYIQAREPAYLGNTSGAAHSPTRTDSLDTAMQRMIAAADTFFIATTFTGESDDGANPHGADVSHRGGKPGFVRIDDARTLTVPDFVGNFYFNTLGNLLLEPRTGLLFMDFATGDLLYVACEAEILFDGPEVAAFTGAQRLLRFHVREALLLERALPLRWGEATLSPNLTPMGAWPAR